jgi:hypothetical protein
MTKSGVVDHADVVGVGLIVHAPAAVREGESLGRYQILQGRSGRGGEGLTKGKVRGLDVRECAIPIVAFGIGQGGQDQVKYGANVGILDPVPSSGLEMMMTTGRGTGRDRSATTSDRLCIGG